MIEVITRATTVVQVRHLQEQKLAQRVQPRLQLDTST